jgi:hypothetical protein
MNNCGRDVLRSDAAKWLRFNRCLESNDDSINAQPEGKTKILFLISLPARLLNRKCNSKLRNSSEKRERNDFYRNSRIRRERI